MSKTIKVNLNKDSYNIRVGDSYLEVVKEIKSNFAVLIVTDTNVGSIYGKKFKASLEAENKFDVDLYEIPAGETSKNMDTVLSICEYCAKLNMDRKSLIVAIGGGVVGDIAGFSASIYLRGIPFIQVPTTVLAQVDASIGGKTGVDTVYGKNQIGTFYQPQLVWIDPSTLQTLDEREYRNGLAEVIKYGIINDKKLFDFFMKNVDLILKRDLKVLEHIIYSCAYIKADVVSKDVKERGLRRILNYGHTLAHAIETFENYKGLKHGEAVALGMVFDAYIGYKKGICDKDVEDQIYNLLIGLGFDINAWKERLKDGTYDVEELRKIMIHDKKIDALNIDMYVPIKLGKCKEISISTKEIKQYLENWIK